MFGLSWAQIAIIVLVGVFVLGPERIPTAVTWVLTSLRKVRTMAAGAQAELRREIGPELDELRRQVADLQSLKEIQELRDLRDLHPKRLIGKNILGDEFSGGITGFLGLTDQPTNPAPLDLGPSRLTTPPRTALASTTGRRTEPQRCRVVERCRVVDGRVDGLVVERCRVVDGTGSNGAGAPAGATAAGSMPVGPAQPGSQTTGAPRPVAPPSMTKLAAPKVVGRSGRRAPARRRPPGNDHRSIRTGPDPASR